MEGGLVQGTNIVIVKVEIKAHPSILVSVIWTCKKAKEANEHKQRESNAQRHLWFQLVH